jgi:hypothetical protein
MVDCAFAASESRKLEKCGINFKSIHWRENPLENLFSRDSSSSKETETQNADEGMVECAQTIHYLSPKSCLEGSGAKQPHCPGDHVSSDSVLDCCCTT